jgi:hypothetical protein
VCWTLGVLWHGAVRVGAPGVGAVWAAGAAHGATAAARCTAPPPPRTRRQFRLLLQRSWRQISRDQAAATARLMSNLSSAAIFGAIFFRMKVRP